MTDPTSPRAPGRPEDTPVDGEPGPTFEELVAEVSARFITLPPGELEAEITRTLAKIPDAAMSALRGYPWPGNVRELRNVLERAMILSSDGTLRIDLPGAVAAPAPGSPKTMVALETEHIRTILEQVGWKIRGAGAAAEILGLKPSTLESR